MEYISWDLWQSSYSSVTFKVTSLLYTQETLVFRYGTVVQTTSESSADRLKVDRTAESNRIHIFGNDSDQGRRIQILQIFNPFFDTTLIKVVLINVLNNYI